MDDALEGGIGDIPLWELADDGLLSFATFSLLSKACANDTGAASRCWMPSVRFSALVHGEYTSVGAWKIIPSAVEPGLSEECLARKSLTTRGFMSNVG